MCKHHPVQKQIQTNYLYKVQGGGEVTVIWGTVTLLEWCVWYIVWMGIFVWVCAGMEVWVLCACLYEHICIVWCFVSSFFSVRGFMECVTVDVIGWD